MSGLRVFCDLASQPTRSVLLLLKFNNIPFQTKLIKIAQGEHLTDEEFGVVNPNRRVPAISDGDFHLTESVAILKYICAKHGLPDHWYPSDLRARAKIDEYLSWHHTNIRLAATTIIWGKLFGPMLAGKPEDENKIANGKQSLSKCLKIFDNHFLKNTKYISSDQISIADLMALCEFSQLDMLEKNFVQLSEKVEEWKDRCTHFLGPTYDDVHSILYKIQGRIRAKSKM